MSDFYNARLRAALLGSVAVVAMAAPAMAQGEKTFNIPAQDAVSAVPSFVQQSDLQVLATAADLKGVRTNAVQGTMAPDAALDALIRGTGLSVKSRDGASVVLVRAATADAAATPAAAETASDAQDVVVVGVRKSLREALDVKRRQVGVMEAVSAKDIGVLPDVTIAETLNRLPGVNAARDRGNDSQASIRGLGARMVLGTVNGREVASSEPDRNIRWEIYPSEVISGASVYKSSEARLLSGGISGTVDLQTIRPLDYRGPSLMLRAGPVYYDGGSRFPGYDGMGYRGSLSWVKKLTPDLAIVLGLTSQKQKNGYESVQGWGYNFGADNGPVLASQPTTKYNTPWGAQSEAKKLTETRTGASLGLQYKPSDSFELAYDLLWSDVKIDENQDQAWYGGNKWGNWDGGNYADYVAGAAIGGQPVIQNGDVVAATLPYGQDQSVVAKYTEDKTLLVTGLNAKWKAGDWTITADAAYSKAERSNLWRAAEFIYYPTSESFDLRGKPVIKVSQDPTSQTQSPMGGQWATGRVADTLSSGQLDFKRNLGESGWTSVLFGVRYADRTKDLADDSASVTPLGTVTSVPQSMLKSYTFKNFDVPTILTGDFSALANYLYGSDLYHDAKSLPTENRVSEKVAEAYLEGTYSTTFAGVPVDGNAGLRVVNAKTEAAGTSSSGGGWFQDLSGNWAYYPLVVTSASGGSNYTKILPSITARFDYGDGRYLKVSAAKVLSRPPLNDLVATMTLSPVAPFTGGGGNPYLKPFEATQIDVSYEWYFGKDSLAAASGYYKKVDNYVGYSQRTQVINGNSYTLTSPVNATKEGFIRGVEFTYQTPLGFLPGFGIYSNLSLVDSDIKEMVYNLPMVGVARTTGTLDLWYSGHGIDARLGTKYHSTYTAIYGWDDSALIRVKPETTLDFSASYTVNSHVQLRLQANNLLDTPLKTYQNNVEDRLGRYDYYGRRVLADVTFKY